MHLHPEATPTGANRIQLVVGGATVTQNLVAGDTDYSFDVTGTAATNVNTNLRGRTTLQVTFQYLDSSGTNLATQNVLLRVLTEARRWRWRADVYADRCRVRQCTEPVTV